MTAQSRMLSQETSKITRNAIFSQGLGDGRMQLDWLDGLTTDQSGRDRHLVSPSQQRVKEKESQTSATSGPSGSTLSASADLQQFLVSRLAQRFATGGSTNSKKTWKPVSTPSGRSLSRLQVSVPSTKETGFGSWPTASARDYKGGYPGGRIRNGKLSVDTLDVAAQLASTWLTPTTSDMNGVRELDGKRSGGLNTQVTGLWATPNTLDHMALRSEEALKRQAQGARKGRTFPCNLREQVDERCQEIYAESSELQLKATTLWGTPVANPANGSPEAFLERKRKAVAKGSKMGVSLTDIQMQAKSVLWPTVTTKDNSQLAGQYSKTNGTTLGGAVRQCNVKTEKSAPSQLNPRFSLWLMGYPTGWASCAERVTPSSRKSRQKS